MLVTEIVCKDMTKQSGSFDSYLDRVGSLEGNPLFSGLCH